MRSKDSNIWRVNVWANRMGFRTESSFEINSNVWIVRLHVWGGYAMDVRVGSFFVQVGKTCCTGRQLIETLEREVHAIAGGRVYRL